MEDIIEENKKLIIKLKNINKKLNVDKKISNLLEVKENIIKFDKQCKILKNILDTCMDINYNNKELFNCNILNIKNKIIDNNKNNNTINDKYIEYKPILSDSPDNKIINLPVICVDSEDEIKNSPIYYLKKQKQFCIKINNNIIKGNIGNIYHKKHKNKVKVNKCEKIFCNKKNCYFYHDNRNFMNYSWIQSIKSIKNPLNKYNTRLLGSADTLLNDLLYVNKNEKDLRNSQLMHDILIYQVLSNYIKLYKI